MRRSFAAIPSISIVNPRVIKANEKDGDWASLAGFEWRRIPAPTRSCPGYRPLEYLDMEIKPGPLPRLVGQPQGGEEDRLPAGQGNLDPHPGPAERHDRLHDTNLPADQVAQIKLEDRPTCRRTWSCGPSSSRMNNTKPPFNNVNAAGPSLTPSNYMGFINDILGGYATRDPYPMPDNLWGIPKDVKGYDYDLKMARSMPPRRSRGRADEAAIRAARAVGERAERAGRASSSRATWRRSAST